MMIAVPYLAERLQNMANNEVKAQFINNVYSIANMPDAEISSVTRDNINKAYDIYNNFITIVDSPEIKNANNSPEIKRNLKQNALDELNQLASEDQSGIVKQLIRIAFKGLMNAKSRDAQNTIR
jgi:tRNA A37 N6-isopentenylltransferase MiaA